MRKPEQQLWDRMRKQITLPNFLLQRIENIVGDGIPDVLCQHRRWGGRTTFIELKVAPKIPVRESTPLLKDDNGVRQAQKNWHLDWNNFGGRSWIIIGIKDNNLLHIAVPGRHADSINNQPMHELINLDGAFMGVGRPFWLDLEKVL